MSLVKIMNYFERRKKEKFIKDFLGERLGITFDPLISYREGNIAHLSFCVEFTGSVDNSMILEIECDENLNTKNIEEYILSNNLFTISLMCILTATYKVRVLNVPPAEIQAHVSDVEYFADCAIKEGLSDLFVEIYLEDIVNDINEAKEKLYFYDLPDTVIHENAFQFVANTLIEYDDQPVENIDCSRSDYLKRKLKTEIANEKNDPAYRKQLNMILNERNFSDKYNEYVVRIEMSIQEFQEWSSMTS